jgi:site-specific DNA-methyltransferase (adenine-specific)
MIPDSVKPFIYYEEPGITLLHGDCLEILPLLEAGSVDLILTDPPYGKVRGDFDEAWTNRVAMLGDCKKWIDAMHRTMKHNATLYWFAWPSLAGRIEGLISEKLNPLSHIIWKKPSTVAQKANPDLLRAPMPETERIIMAEPYMSDNIAKGETVYHLKCDELRGFIFEPLRAYLDGERQRAGFTPKQCNEVCGNQMSGHYFTQTQWTLPTRENYEKLQAAFNSKGADMTKDFDVLHKDYRILKKEYDILKRDFDDLKKEFEDLRRPFCLDKNDPKTDVWEFTPPKPSERMGHPTPKPLELITFMCRISSKKDAVILDPFMGSGTTALAAKQLGRKCIGIELEQEYLDMVVERLKQEVLF